MTDDPRVEAAAKALFDDAIAGGSTVALSSNLWGILLRRAAAALAAADAVTPPDWTDDANMSTAQTLNRFYSLPPAPSGDVALVERLRTAAENAGWDSGPASDYAVALDNAADALERLTAERDAALAEVERLREDKRRVVAAWTDDEDDAWRTIDALRAQVADLVDSNQTWSDVSRQVCEAAGVSVLVRVPDAIAAMRAQVAAVRALCDDPTWTGTHFATCVRAALGPDTGEGTP